MKISLSNLVKAPAFLDVIPAEEFTFNLHNDEVILSAGNGKRWIGIQLDAYDLETFEPFSIQRYMLKGMMEAAATGGIFVLEFTQPDRAFFTHQDGQGFNAKIVPTLVPLPAQVLGGALIVPRPLLGQWMLGMGPLAGDRGQFEGIVLEQRPAMANCVGTLVVRTCDNYCAAEMADCAAHLPNGPMRVPVLNEESLSLIASGIASGSVSIRHEGRQTRMECGAVRIHATFEQEASTFPEFTGIAPANPVAYGKDEYLKLPGAIAQLSRLKPRWYQFRIGHAPRIDVRTDINKWIECPGESSITGSLQDYRFCIEGRLMEKAIKALEGQPITISAGQAGKPVLFQAGTLKLLLSPIMPPINSYIE